MDEIRKSKIERFMADPVSSQAVFDTLMKSFLRPKASAGVNELAASYLAVGQLQEAWRELERISAKPPGENRGQGQVGL